ncbi:MAG: histidine phosphatase family protein [Oscillospiraceae bacterium]|nr:histidine phosphatase family protein [Oscillospiraceae bacterium]
MMNVVGIVPAAGLSSRMGAFKPLLPVDSEAGEGCVSALERTVSVLRGAGAGRVFVVTGKNAEKLRGPIADLHAEEVYNNNFMLGMSFSLLAGVRAAEAAGADGALLLPCDTPAVMTESVRAVLAAADAEHFAVACFRGKKGHPLWIPRRFFSEILFSGNVKAVTRAHEDELVRVETGREGVVLDMDTPEDYQRVLDYLVAGESDLGEMAKNRRVILVRHGETTRHPGPIFMGQYDPQLSPLGFGAAVAVSARIEDMSPRVSRVYSSDLRRAVATGAAIAGRLRTGMVLMPGLRELSLGAWDGRLIEDIKAAYPEDYEKRGKNLLSFKPEGGENFYDLRYRAARTLIGILRKDRARDILIVTHAGVMTALRSAITGEEMDPADKPPLNAIITITGDRYRES